MTPTAPLEKRNTLIVHIGIILTVIAWGSSFVMTKVLLEKGLGPAESYAYRSIIAYFLMILLSHKRLWAHNLREELIFVAIGMCAGSIYFIAENTALEYTLVSNVSLITTTSPLITAILIGLIYKSEKPRGSVIVGSFIALIGVGLVIFNSSLDIKVNPLGDFLALAASLSWAVYSILLRRVNTTYDALFITRKTFFYGLITTFPFILLSGEPFNPHILAEPVVWGNLIGLGAICSVLAYILWAQAVQRLGAVSASNYLYFQPVVTLIVSAVVLGEMVTLIGYIGCGMILLGVFISDFLNRPKKSTSS